LCDVAGMRYEAELLLVAELAGAHAVRCLILVVLGKYFDLGTML
jgi:hypothetical protein